MRTFKYTINGQEVAITVSEIHSTVTDIRIDGEQPQVDEAKMPEYMAVIALALIQNDVEVVHDEEEGVITLGQTSSTWNNPAGLINRLGIK